MNNVIFEEIILLLTLVVVAIALLKRFRIAPILAYLLVGILVSPNALGLISDNQDVRFIAEFGVVFLMFTMGLEFSLDRLITLHKEVLGLGGVQVMLTALLAGSIDWYFSRNIQEAIIVGGIIALSSTAIVIKQLSEQLELNSRHGHLAVSILIFQDLAVIPLLIIIPTFAAQESVNLTPDLWPFLKSGIILLIMLAIGHWILRPLLRVIAHSRSAELFTLSVLLIALSAAWATHEAGLSLALGSFIAGMMLSETEYRHQIEVDIRPFQDILLGLFFITVGMLLNINSLLSQLHWIILVTVLLLTLKTIITSLLCYLFGAPAGVSFRTGLVLSQGGEFGFAILTLAATYQVIPPQTMQIVLSAIILSMMLTPWLINNNGRWAKNLFHTSYMSNRENIARKIAQSAQGLSEHIIICGYSRIGQNISRFIEEETQQSIALDLDSKRIQEAQYAGELVVYGDPTHGKVLKAAGILKAKVLVIAIKDTATAKKIIEKARTFRNDIPVLVRTLDETEMDDLYESGATDVIPESLESSIIMALHLLIHLDVPLNTITHDIAHARKNRYQFLRGFYPGEEATHVQSGPLSEHMHTIVLYPGARVIGMKIGELNLDGRNIVFTALRRGGIRGKEPTPDVLLKENDVRQARRPGIYAGRITDGALNPLYPNLLLQSSVQYRLSP